MNVRELSVDRSFEHSYGIERLAERPNSSLPIYYLSPNQHDGPILRVTAKTGEKFIVIVPGEERRFAVVTWPNAERFLAIPSGYLVDTITPSESRQLHGFDGHGVHYVFPVPEHKLVLAGHCCGICCYDCEGVVWTQDELFCCEDPAIDLCGEQLLVTAHKHGEDPGDAPVLKRLTLLTGKRLV